MIAQYATGQVEPEPDELKLPDERQVKSGARGGKVRAQKLSSKERKESAEKVAKTRWKQS